MSLINKNVRLIVPDPCSLFSSSSFSPFSLLIAIYEAMKKAVKK